MLPISGSVKARGGIYEVLQYAETLAFSHGLLTVHDNYSILTESRFRDFFGKYSIAVGATGNRRLSIGIMGAKFGFQVAVHMSADGWPWKKDLLRNHGMHDVTHIAWGTGGSMVPVDEMGNHYRKGMNLL